MYAPQGRSFHSVPCGALHQRPVLPSAGGGVDLKVGSSHPASAVTTLSVYLGNYLHYGISCTKKCVLVLSFVFYYCIRCVYLEHMPISCIATPLLKLCCWVLIYKIKKHISMYIAYLLSKHISINTKWEFHPQFVPLYHLNSVTTRSVSQICTLNSRSQIATKSQIEPPEQLPHRPWTHFLH